MLSVKSVVNKKKLCASASLRSKLYSRLNFRFSQAAKLHLLTRLLRRFNHQFYVQLFSAQNHQYFFVFSHRNTKKCYYLAKKVCNISLFQKKILTLSPNSCCNNITLRKNSVYTLRIAGNRRLVKSPRRLAMRVCRVPNGYKNKLLNIVLIIQG